MSEPDRGAERRTSLAGERTGMANERTQLAWWRTGLTAIAVALGVGRVLPEIAQASVVWPYTLLGVGFAAYGVVMIGYGTHRARVFNPKPHARQAPRSEERLFQALTVAGMVLGLAAALLIVFA